MNATAKINDENGAEIICLRPAKSPQRPALAGKTAKSPARVQADISSMCVSKDPHKRELFVPARIVAEAVRLILDEELPPPRGPGRIGSDLDIEFGNLPGGWHVAGQDPLANPDMPGFRFGFNAKTARDIRSPFNRDADYRSRAELREVCRKNPAAFADAIPHDIAERVTIPNSRDEALAILEAVRDVDNREYGEGRLRNRDGTHRLMRIGRPAREWLHADPDEPVLLVDYNPPKVRLRSRPIPGVVLSRDDGAIVLTLRARDLDSPSQRKRQEAAPEPVKLAA
jgi:hypothetical protein